MIESLFRNPSFLFFVAGRSCNVMGVQIFTVAVGWHVYQLTRDPLDLGYIGLAQFAPVLLLFLLAGYVSDRFDRRLTMLLSNLTHVAGVFLLMISFWHELESITAILWIMALHGASRVFYHTASQAILPNLVMLSEFPRAVAIASIANKAAQLIGPALGGILVAWAGDWTYYVTLVMFLLAGISAIIMSRRLSVRLVEKITIRTLFGGFIYVWQKKIILGAISIDLMAVLLGSVMGLLPIYASDILKVGADGLGIMRAMPGFGSLLVGFWLSRIKAPYLMGPTMFGALAVFGFSITVFSISEWFWLSLLCLAIYGAADMVSVYIRLTVVQLATPDTMRGRVSAINSVSINASNELGDFRAGIMAAGLGTVQAVLIGGLATLAFTGLWLKMFPDLRRINRLEEVSDGIAIDDSKDSE